MGIEIKAFFCGVETQEKSTVEKKNCQMQKIAHTQSESFFFLYKHGTNIFCFRAILLLQRFLFSLKAEKKNFFLQNKPKRNNYWHQNVDSLHQNFSLLLHHWELDQLNKKRFKTKHKILVKKKIKKQKTINFGISIKFSENFISHKNLFFFESINQK